MPATPQERAAALWSFAYFFALLAGYYVLRPLRDQMGIAGGVKNLPWLFTATFVTLLVAQPSLRRLGRKAAARALYSDRLSLLRRKSRLVFWVLLTFGVETVIVARVFFVWVSVFNLFAVAVFWSFMADLFTSEQGKRLFRIHRRWRHGRRVAGPDHHDLAVRPAGTGKPNDRGGDISRSWRFFAYTASSVLRYVTCGSAHNANGKDRRQRIRGHPRAVRSPYILGIGAWVALLSYAATIIYFEQAHIVSEAVKSAGLQTRIFASIDLAVSLLTLVTQVVGHRAGSQTRRHRHSGGGPPGGLHCRLRCRWR